MEPFLKHDKVSVYLVNFLGVIMAFKYEGKVDELLSEYKGAFVFSLVVIISCGFIHTCTCLKSEQ